MSSPLEQGLVEHIYTLVCEIPSGKVSTYGDIAAISGRCDARTIGYALNELSKDRAHAVPWQRVVNASGGISTRGSRQRELLEAEGVVFDARGRADLGRYRWAGPDPLWAEMHGVTPLLPPSDTHMEDGQGQLRLF